MGNAFQELMRIRNQANAPLVEVTGVDPVYSTSFRLAETAAAALGAVGTAISDIHELKTGRRQTASIDVRHAAAALHSFAHLQCRQDNGDFAPIGNSPAAEVSYQITQPFETKDGRWFLPHFGMKHLKERVIGILACEPTPQAVAAALSRWDARELEDVIADAGACGGMIRTPAEWLAHPHGRALAARPVVEIEKIADSDPEPFPAGEDVLSGMRVLDLTRILAGPVAARTCAEFGADVLMVGARGVPQIRNFVMDLSHGKRSCLLDLNEAAEAERLRELVKEADVFSQGYRPGVLEARGFGPEELAELRPGLVYTTINCYGPAGPFANRAGWEQVAQSVTGICHENARQMLVKSSRNAREVRERIPTLLPVNACDYITGYLGAYGTLLALARRAVEGGSYRVSVSLCQTAMLLDREGRVDEVGSDPDPSDAEIAALQMETQTSYGHLRHLAPVLRFSETRPTWSRPTPALGGDAAEWLSR
jgi:crotonobetainyl-CoA:carnitine CoA-transferase CaiB-like acyl-CoA transferase